jgi:hypothetical protein
MKDGFQDQGTLEGEIGVAAWCAGPWARFCLAPGSDRFLIEPHGETPAVDQGAIVLAPVADARAEDIVLSYPGRSVTTGLPR